MIVCIKDHWYFVDEIIFSLMETPLSTEIDIMVYAPNAEALFEVCLKNRDKVVAFEYSPDVLIEHRYPEAAALPLQPISTYHNAVQRYAPQVI